MVLAIWYQTERISQCHVGLILHGDTETIGLTAGSVDTSAEFGVGFSSRLAMSTVRQTSLTVDKQADPPGVLA